MAFFGLWSGLCQIFFFVGFKAGHYPHFLFWVKLSKLNLWPYRLLDGRRGKTVRTGGETVVFRRIASLVQKDLHFGTEIYTLGHINAAWGIVICAVSIWIIVPFKYFMALRPPLGAPLKTSGYPRKRKRPTRQRRRLKYTKITSPRNFEKNFFGHITKLYKQKLPQISYYL